MFDLVIVRNAELFIPQALNTFFFVRSLLNIKNAPTIIKGRLNICLILIGNAFSNASWFSLVNSIKNLAEKTRTRNKPNKKPFLSCKPFVWYNFHKTKKMSS